MFNESGIKEFRNSIPDHFRARRSNFFILLGTLIFKFYGWKIEGSLPNKKRVIITAAPHTSYEDFIRAFPLVLALDIKVNFLAKDSIFKFGIKHFFSWLGGIPVNRNAPIGAKKFISNLGHERDAILLGITPEGTRKKVIKWKTGILRIAKEINAEIVLTGIDFEHKRFVFGEIFKPTGDNEKDINSLKLYFKKYKGKHPERF